MKKQILLSLFLITLLFSIFSGCVNNTNVGNSDDDEIHDFTFTTLDGSIKKLSDYRGKVVIVDLWATWCGPCTYVMPELKKIYIDYNRTELEIISIDIDTSETVEKIEGYISDFAEYYGIQLNWIFARDSDNIAEKYLKDGKIPTLTIFDQVGRLCYHEVGVHGYIEVPYGFPSDTPLLASVLEDLIN